MGRLLELDKVVTVWLDEVDDIGIVEIEDSILGAVFYPIARDDISKERYCAIDYLWFPNYQGARRNITPYITGKLSKRSVSILK